MVRTNGVVMLLYLNGCGKPEGAKDFGYAIFIPSNYRKMKNIILVVGIFFPFYSFSQIYDCNKLIVTKKDRIEGTETIANVLPTILSDSLNKNNIMSVGLILNSDKTIILAFWSDKKCTIRKNDAIKILFADGSRTSISNEFGSVNYDGQWVNVICKDKNKPYFYTNDDVIKKEIQAIRFYYAGGSFDFFLNHSDANILQQALSCMYDRI